MLEKLLNLKPGDVVSATVEGGRVVDYNVSKGLRIEQAAARIGMSVSWLRKQTAAGLFPCYRIGRAVRFDLQQLEAWLRLHTAGVLA
jgi:excisionase family DNA binding protein